MSEFSIDEKANAYDLALNKAKTLLSKCKRVSDKASIIYRAEDIENIFPELQKPSDEKIKETLIELVKCNERCGYTLLNNVSTSSMLAWIEKQGQSKKTSIWKHWKNGICGNGEGKLVFLIKSGATYSLSSCLSFECDYIELSELENLMLEKQDELPIKWNKNTEDNKPPINHSILMKTIHGIVEGEWKGENWYQYRWAACVKDSDVLSWIELSNLNKQGKQNTNIVWHDISEEPEEQREIFCKWKGSTDTIWHDVAFYHADTKTFWDGEHQIEDVIKWAYVDEIIKD